MIRLNRLVAGLIGVLLSGVALLSAQSLAFPHERGQGVTPVFEGWYRNPDGTFTLSFGYLNRNFKEEVDVPVSAENRFSPGAEDRGQPTHFLPRRHWGVFGVVVPADFRAQKVTWTITANGQTNAVPGSLNPIYEIPAMRESTAGNTPPRIRFARDGSVGQGPLGATDTRTVSDRSLELPLWVEDDGVVSLQQEGRATPLALKWSRYRGPGTVTFTPPSPAVGRDGRASTLVTFERPGDYVLRVLANDHSGDGGGGSQCCWTNGYVQVSVP